VIVVPDAGPLIYLGGAGQLDLLQKLYVRVVVPRVVWDEVVVHGAGQVGAAEVAAATWLERTDATPDPGLLSILDVGEAAAIPLAERLGATLLCDDADGRSEARRRGLPVVGTLGVLLRGKREGHLTEIAPIVARMTALGMFVAPSLLAQVWVLAGEVPAQPDKS
jgi:predicted nucleic acid-binding protein